jgi:hypothetical protein
MVDVRLSDLTIEAEVETVAPRVSDLTIEAEVNTVAPRVSDLTIEAEVNTVAPRISDLTIEAEVETVEPSPACVSGPNVISADIDSQKHYLHEGFSSTIVDSYGAPAKCPSGITWDGSHVLSVDADGQTHYRHAGFSATITDSYAAPSECPSGITWDGSNVISVDTDSQKHYRHNGFSATITDSYTAPAECPNGVTWDGENVISADTESQKHYLHEGFSATITDSYDAPVECPSGIAWDGFNVVSADADSQKHYLHEGFSSVITDSYYAPAECPSGISFMPNFALSQSLPVIEAFAVPPPESCACSWDEDTECMIVTWADNVVGEWSYWVERRIVGSAWIPLAELPANSESFEDCTVARGFAYQYRIRSRYSDTGYSAWCTTTVCRTGTPQVWEDEDLEANYSVVIRDPHGQSLALADAYERLEYRKVLNDQGEYDLRFEPSVMDPDDFGLDHLISVMRHPPGGSWLEDFTGLQRYDRFAINDAGKDQFRSVGPGLLNLLRRRIIEPPEGEAFLSLTGPFTDIMKALVRTQIGSLADEERQFPGVSVSPDTGSGVELGPLHYRYDNLYEMVQTLSGLGADFTLERVEDAAFRFTTHFPQRGLDRRIDNPDGNAPVVFSIDRANMAEPVRENNRLEEVTHAYVAGEGVGANREIVERSSLVDAQEDSPFNRIEDFLEASSETSTAALMALGDAFLWENRQNIEFTFEVKPTPDCLYSVDWDLGYLVTGVHKDAIYDLQVTEVHVTVDESGEHIVPTLKVLGWEPIEDEYPEEDESTYFAG